MSYSYTTTVEVEVDIDETDLSNEDLMEMCQERGLISMDKAVLEELFVLFKQGKHDAILALVRRVVQDAKGVVL
jgi:hypothetical protein